MGIKWYVDISFEPLVHWWNDFWHYRQAKDFVCWHVCCENLGNFSFRFSWNSTICSHELCWCVWCHQTMLIGPIHLSVSPRKQKIHLSTVTFICVCVSKPHSWALLRDSNPYAWFKWWTMYFEEISNIKDGQWLQNHPFSNNFIKG